MKRRGFVGALAAVIAAPKTLSAIGATPQADDGFPPGLHAHFVPESFDPMTGVWRDISGNGNDLAPGSWPFLERVAFFDRELSPHERAAVKRKLLRS